MRYCMDCGHYQPGGFCKKQNKIVGALFEQCDENGMANPQMTGINEKRCPKCGRVLPIDSFALNRRELDGRQIYCRDCQLEAYRKWYRKHVKAD